MKIGEALRRSVEMRPDREFVVGMGERITYADFDRQALTARNRFPGTRRRTRRSCRLLAHQWPGLDTHLARVLPHRRSDRRFDQYPKQGAEVDFILRQSDAKVLVAMPSYWETDYLAMIGELAPGC